jgi:hypothetical protein
MDNRWAWAVRYIGVIVLAIALGAAFGSMELFKTTKVGKSGLNAARIVEFLSYGGALFIFWTLARHAAGILQRDGGRWKLVGDVLVPLATLIVVASGQAVLLLVVGPFMSRTALGIYNWLFIAAIIASAAWLVAILFTGRSSLTELFDGSADAGGPSSNGAAQCRACGAALSNHERFCPQCGAAAIARY